jgi:hypothetical protein
MEEGLFRVLRLRDGIWKSGVAGEAIGVWVVAKIQQGEVMGRESGSFFVFLFFSRGTSSLFNL